MQVIFELRNSENPSSHYTMNFTWHPHRLDIFVWGKQFKMLIHFMLLAKVMIQYLRLLQVQFDSLSGQEIYIFLCVDYTKIFSRLSHNLLEQLLSWDRVLTVPPTYYYRGFLIILALKVILFKILL